MRTTTFCTSVELGLLSLSACIVLLTWTTVGGSFAGPLSAPGFFLTGFSLSLYLSRSTSFKPSFPPFSLPFYFLYGLPAVCGLRLLAINLVSVSRVTGTLSTLCCLLTMTRTFTIIVPTIYCGNLFVCSFDCPIWSPCSPSFSFFPSFVSDYCGSLSLFLLSLSPSLLSTLASLRVVQVVRVHGCLGADPWIRGLN